MYAEVWQTVLVLLGTVMVTQVVSRDRHIMLFLEPIMLCSNSQFCFHYAHATIPIMPALCSNLIQKPPSTLGIWYKSKLSVHCNFVVLSDFYRISINSSINDQMSRMSTCVHVMVILTTSSPIMLA